VREIWSCCDTGCLPRIADGEVLQGPTGVVAEFGYRLTELGINKTEFGFGGRSRQLAILFEARSGYEFESLFEKLPHGIYVKSQA
jgi:hypothetical protein